MGVTRILRIWCVCPASWRHAIGRHQVDRVEFGLNGLPNMTPIDYRWLLSVCVSLNRLTIELKDIIYTKALKPVIILYITGNRLINIKPIIMHHCIVIALPCTVLCVPRQSRSSRYAWVCEKKSSWLSSQRIYVDSVNIHIYIIHIVYVVS